MHKQTPQSTAPQVKVDNIICTMYATTKSKSSDFSIKSSLMMLLLPCSCLFHFTAVDIYRDNVDFLKCDFFVAVVL